MPTDSHLSSTSHLKRDGRLFSLDALRGLAALAVVFTHYKSFFHDEFGYSLDHEKQPLYSIFAPFYDWGGFSVDLFFALSGFIFYWLYSKQIFDGKISAWKFSILRFSRLYPLHFATLVFMAFTPLVFQIPSTLVDDHTVKNFLLHVFFASNWWRSESGFNGPAWSISVEVLLYAIFYLMCRLRAIRWWWLCIPIIVGWKLGYTYQGRGLYWFFVGGLLCYFWHWIISKKLSFKLIVVLLCLAWTIPAVYLYCRYLCNSIGRDGVPYIVRLIAAPSFSLVFFPLTILTAALVDHKLPSRRLAWLGDISYSLYLLHMPIIYTLIGVFASFGFPRSVFYSTWILFLLFVLLISASTLCYRRFELPAQRILRSKLLPRLS